MRVGRRHKPFKPFKPQLQKIPEIEGRLLTPEEGCGLTKVKITRIVGGAEAPIAAWPWVVLLGYENFNGTAFHCGKKNLFIPCLSQNNFFLKINSFFISFNRWIINHK